MTQPSPITERSRTNAWSPTIVPRPMRAPANTIACAQIARALLDHERRGRSPRPPSRPRAERRRLAEDRAVLDDDAVADHDAVVDDDVRAEAHALAHLGGRAEHEAGRLIACHADSLRGQ